MWGVEGRKKRGVKGLDKKIDCNQRNCRLFDEISSKISGKKKKEIKYQRHDNCWEIIYVIILIFNFFKMLIRILMEIHVINFFFEDFQVFFKKTFKFFFKRLLIF